MCSSTTDASIFRSRPRHLRPDHARAAAHLVRRGRSPLLEGVLRPCPLAADRTGIHQSVAADLSGPDEDGAVDDSRLHRRLPAIRPAVRGASRSPAHRYSRSRYRARPIRTRRRADDPPRGSRRPRSPQSGQRARDCRSVRRLGANAGRSNQRRASRYRRLAINQVQRALSAQSWRGCSSERRESQSAA